MGAHRLDQRGCVPGARHDLVPGVREQARKPFPEERRVAAAIAEVRAHGTQQSYGGAGTSASALALISGSTATPGGAGGWPACS